MLNSEKRVPKRSWGYYCYKWYPFFSQGHSFFFNNHVYKTDVKWIKNKFYSTILLYNFILLLHRKSSVLSKMLNCILYVFEPILCPILCFSNPRCCFHYFQCFLILKIEAHFLYICFQIVILSEFHHHHFVWPCTITNITWSDPNLLHGRRGFV